MKNLRLDYLIFYTYPFGYAMRSEYGWSPFALAFPVRYIDEGQLVLLNLDYEEDI